MTIYAIRVDGLILDGRYLTWDSAVEAAQEDEKLLPDDSWQVVVLGLDGRFYESPPFGIEFFLR